MYAMTPLPAALWHFGLGGARPNKRQEALVAWEELTFGAERVERERGEDVFQMTKA